MQETWVPSLGQEDPLEEGMAAYSSILACKIPWTEEPGGLQSRGSQPVSWGSSDMLPLRGKTGKKIFFKDGGDLLG